MVGYVVRSLMVTYFLFSWGAWGEGKHAFICADSGLGKLKIFSDGGRCIWEYDCSDCYDVSILPNKHILFTETKDGKGWVREMTREKKVVFTYQTEGEVFSCERLKNGNTLVGCCTAGKLVEVDRKGNVVKTITVVTEKKGHGTMRWARKTPWGTYLVAHIGEKAVREYNDQSEVVRELKFPVPAFAAIPLKNKNILIATQTAVVEFAPDGKEVWRLADKDIPKTDVGFLTGIRRLKNGNTQVCNWLGHHREGTGWPFFEVSAEKKIVWHFSDTTQTKWVASAQFLK